MPHKNQTINTTCKYRHTIPPRKKESHNQNKSKYTGSIPGNAAHCPRDHTSRTQPPQRGAARGAGGCAAYTHTRSGASRITQRTISINPNRSPHTFAMALDNTQRPMASPGPGHAARLDTCVRACESLYSQPQLPAQPNPAQPSAPRPTAARRAATEGVRRE